MQVEISLIPHSLLGFALWVCGASWWAVAIPLLILIVQLLLIIMEGQNKKPQPPQQKEMRFH